MPKFIRYLLAALILGALLFALGPRPQFAPLDPQPDPRRWPIDEVASVVLPREAALPDLKPGNAAYFVWADSTAPTDYALVYLHGFSASPREGGPLHERFADHYGYNLYLPRLPGHGLAGPDAFAGPEAKDWVDAAKEAVAIGKSIGRRVILMATSTGATLALYLAAADPDIAALILMAPNIDLYSSSSRLLNGPWGRP
ncbi:MAG: alpha/beta hydrolase, partial [Lewinella sp.]|nr:alpha/beta hydrolase [Lewinella sp.]